MNSGSFHVMAQEWRYFSREKSIVHTLHLGQLSPTVTGQSVFITPVPPTGTGQNGFGFKPQPYPIITPYGGVQWSKVTNNIPPFWTSSLQTIGFNPQSGTYGFSGTFGPYDTSVSNQTFVWSSTGGTFLLEGIQEACANPSDLMSSMQCKLFTSNQDQVMQNEIHEGQYYILLGGGDWYNLFYVAEASGGHEPMQCSVIVDNVPAFTSLGVRNNTSPLEPAAGCSFLGTGVEAMRLGPS